MISRWFSLTPGEASLFTGLLLAVAGIVLICVAGEVSLSRLRSLMAAGSSLVLTGVFLWLYGAITRQAELLGKHELFEPASPGHYSKATVSRDRTRPWANAQAVRLKPN